MSNLFNVMDNITGAPVRTDLDGRLAVAVCASLNVMSGPGGRYDIWVIEDGIARRMTWDEYIDDAGHLALWD